MRAAQALADRVRTLLGARRRLPAKGVPDLAALQSVIGYSFKKEELLLRALTHKSFLNPDNDIAAAACNERLEFLGDAVISCLICEFLFNTYPHKAEGFLSKVKSLIVSRKILGEVGQALALGDFLRLGHAERKSGALQRSSAVSNAFEALVGAIYLDSGLPAVKKFLQQVLFVRVDEFLEDEQNVNYKSVLLEMSQRDGFGLPRYSLLCESGPDHDKAFTVEVAVCGMVLGQGGGSNKKIAQQQAAKVAVGVYDTTTIQSHHKGEKAHELVSD